MKRNAIGYLDILVVGLSTVFMLGLFIIFGCTSAWCSNVPAEIPPVESNVVVESVDMEKFNSVKVSIRPEPVYPFNDTTDISENVEEPVVEPTKEPVKYYDVPLSEQLQDHIFALCEYYRINPAIVIAIIEKESNYRDWVMGDSGRSYGLMQVQKRWHEARMKKLGVTDLLDPYQNVAVGIDILAELLHRNNDIEWALMAYNGGASYANNLASQGIVSKYANRVLEISRGLEMVVK